MNFSSLNYQMLQALLGFILSFIIMVIIFLVFVSIVTDLVKAKWCNEVFVQGRGL